MLCWLGVWVYCRVLWVVGVCVGRVSRPPAGRGPEVEGGCLGFPVGLRFVGGGRLLVGGARRQGLRFGGQWPVVGYFVLALVPLLCVHGALWVYEGA